ncbi:hypothetical protein BDV98DRAFT_548477 [Pterulicium gracile]|uniref:NF-X1-type domain-containing protein n=1 Tax=Pterulicium gracile TaxID=1884261 RepID=A0A5C3QKU0_9AGAR|nr:hypothetical protein BDV98DRAFT_548477 [Pterula gracilis]
MSDITPSSSTARESTSKPRSGYRGRGRSARRGGKARTDISVGQSSTSTTSRQGQAPRRIEQEPKASVVPNDQGNGEGSSTRLPPSRRDKGKRRFAGQLTSQQDESGNVNGQRDQAPHHRRPASLAADADLTTTLIHELSFPPYADCAICFSAIHPAQPTWSCSPPAGQCCWTTFHLKCIKPWAQKSVKDLEDAWATRGEYGRKCEWRCPGCQTKRQTIPGGYRCFCGSTPSPPLTRLHTPHSCGSSCSRSRNCPHACPLPCHPGPCPPCKVTLTQSCLCGEEQMLVKCGQAPQSPQLTCTESCKLPLACGHSCGDGCHVQPCRPCQKRVIQTCVCGKEETEVICGEREGALRCSNTCTSTFTCGVHQCDELCHEHSSYYLCPFDPVVVTRCPCGTHPIQEHAKDSLIVPRGETLVLPRTECTQPIPTCSSICNKPLPPTLCSSTKDVPHTCQMKCHTGPCTQPCRQEMTLPCRCGSTSKSVVCWQLALGEEGEGPGGSASAVAEILCTRTCTALRYCGRHACKRVCCPLASLGKVAKGKGKKKTALDLTAVEMLDLDADGLHVCDLVCGKPLGCGLHKCDARDHAGPCAPCHRSSFDEVICHCGLTILDPPVPCGTVLRCPHTCMRPPPPCGHPRHACYTLSEREDPRSGCPPCAFLGSKICACGKKELGNVTCSRPREKVSCGTVCAKTLACGFHKCSRLCHAGDCGTCTEPCGKPRKLCFPAIHPCALPCHAPSTCPEDKEHPCKAIITLTCPCGRIQQSAHCNTSTATKPITNGYNSTPNRGALQPKCNSECAIAQRNARLAEALGISPKDKGGDEAGVVWKDEVLVFARTNGKFVSLVERTFEEFVKSSKKHQVLPQMPPEKRRFVIDVAAVYRMDTQMVDVEPHRSVQILRRVDTRIPRPLLSTAIIMNVPSPSPSPGPGLGKLATRLPPKVAAQPASRPVESGWDLPNTSASGTATPVNALPASSWMARRAEYRRTESVPNVVEAPAMEKEAVTEDWEDDDEI